MIVDSSKPLFFAATALMSMASFYGSELLAQGPRSAAQAETAKFPQVEFGGPRQLSVPPGFPVVALAASVTARCAPQQPGVAHAAAGCGANLSEEQRQATTAVLPLDGLEKKDVSKVSIGATPAAIEP